MGRVIFREFLPDSRIARRVKQATLGFEAIATGPAAFLLIVLQRLGQAGMNHVPHIRLVDPHSEGDGRHDCPAAVLNERFLVRLAVRVFHAGMVGQGGMAGGTQSRAQLVDLSAGDAVDDARFVGVPLEHIGDLPLQIAAAFDADPKKVGTTLGGVPVSPMDELDAIVRERSIVVGVLAVPTDAAQQAADHLIDAGVKIVFNYTQALIDSPSDVQVHTSNPAVELLYALYFHLT